MDYSSIDANKIGMKNLDNRRSSEIAFGGNFWVQCGKFVENWCSVANLLEIGEKNVVFFGEKNC